MVSFSCEGCGDVLTKKKLDSHRNQCYGASFTCLDCMVHFQGMEYRSHTSCMSEAQKYQGHLYKGEKKGKSPHQKSVTIIEPANVPRKAYVEDEMEDGTSAGVVAVIDVPPRAPSPPSAVQNPAHDVNVFDYLVPEGTPGAAQAALTAPSPPQIKSQEVTPYQHTNGHDPHFESHGYTYGDAPLQPDFNRYDSLASLADPLTTNGRSIMAPPPYVTPVPKRERESKKSDKKRKRHQLEELDMSRVRQTQDTDMTDAPPILHSGLTGGLSRLLARPVDFLVSKEAGPSPSSPLKVRKRDRGDREDRDDKRHVSETTHTSTHSGSRHHTQHDTSADARGRDAHRSAEPERRRKHRRHKHHRDSSSSDEHTRSSRKHVKAIEYGHHRASASASAEPGANSNGQVVMYKSPADLFMSFVNKGPESERGLSINKALKRYHREREIRGEKEDHGDKELWKELRIRRNEIGEIVLFM